MFALVAWNLLVYVLLLVRPIVLGRGAAGPVRSLLIRVTSVRASGDSSRADAARWALGRLFLAGGTTPELG